MHIYHFACVHMLYLQSIESSSSQLMIQCDRMRSIHLTCRRFRSTAKANLFWVTRLHLADQKVRNFYSPCAMWTLPGRRSMIVPHLLASFLCLVCSVAFATSRRKELRSRNREVGSASHEPRREMRDQGRRSVRLCRCCGMTGCL